MVNALTLYGIGSAVQHVKRLPVIVAAESLRIKFQNVCPTVLRAYRCQKVFWRRDNKDLNLGHEQGLWRGFSL
jgi:hypothetical protein